MVYVKQVELSRFKSFGNTIKIPLLPGFTVISGPNGSGKSNILDAILFCLGLANSKGMRADRLPDLINTNHINNGRSVEAIVSVIFDISDLTDNQGLELEKVKPESQVNDNNDNSLSSVDNAKNLSEFKVTRRLKVTKGGNYSSTYYINDVSCTAGDLASQLNRLRIYPEGYNIVLQGDVTRIITMNSKERREIIDELAGVAEFDRKIEQTRKTLDEVKEREERCEIIEQELIKNSERLKHDSQKAEKYKQLKAKIQEKQQWEVVLNWQSLQQERGNLDKTIVEITKEKAQIQQHITTLSKEIEQQSAKVNQLNHQVKELGEEEQISIASKLATQKAKRQQLKQRKEELTKHYQQLTSSSEQTQSQIKEEEELLNLLNQEKLNLEQNILPKLTQEVAAAKKDLTITKDKASSIASQSQEWIEKQTLLNHDIAQIQENLNPKITQKALLNERYQQLEHTIATQHQQLENIHLDISKNKEDTLFLVTELDKTQLEEQTLVEKVSNIDKEISLSQKTINRLSHEEREKERLLDKLEAKKELQQEAQGTYATKIILQSDLPGICGLVAQLAQVEPRYQLALETAAGGRLGFIVVEDDSIAATGIKLLKQQKAGRATFLPLNKIKSPRFNDMMALKYASGFVDLAVNLIDCDAKYEKIFAYVFGQTVVFENIDDARAYLGKHRIVTLDGELLEMSGAMSGGSFSSRSSLHFGRVINSDSGEIKVLKDRLLEIESILTQLKKTISEKDIIVNNNQKKLAILKQQIQEKNLIRQQLTKNLALLNSQKEDLTVKLANNNQQLIITKKELDNLEVEIPILERDLKEKQQELSDLESSNNNKEWQQIQGEITIKENELESLKEGLRKEELKLQELINKCLTKTEKIAQLKEKVTEFTQQQEEIVIQQENLSQKLIEVKENIALNDHLFKELATKLKEIKQQRDDAETMLKNLQNKEQKSSWNLQKLEEKQQEKQENLESLMIEIKSIAAELPNPLPNIPFLVNNLDFDEDLDIDKKEITFPNFKDQLEQLQREIKQGMKKLEAMEPVNMLALEEYETNQKRLVELSEKLATLKEERTELLIRVENFTTLRFTAFKEAFDAVNENFKTIFATLSEGDGKLQLEDENDPFNGGLNLIAHPKGKPVKRLSSMSGGEKSLTALSFIFALQKYRPSPFYGFDEVDMFLDGANVEKLSKMIKLQSQQAQFIVVSLRRPMIEASQQTIGVTQAKGAYTQVLGIKL